MEHLVAYISMSDVCCVQYTRRCVYYWVCSYRLLTFSSDNSIPILITRLRDDCVCVCKRKTIFHVLVEIMRESELFTRIRYTKIYRNLDSNFFFFYLKTKINTGKDALRKQNIEFNYWRRICAEI